MIKHISLLSSCVWQTEPNCRQWSYSNERPCWKRSSRQCHCLRSPKRVDGLWLHANLVTKSLGWMPRWWSYKHQKSGTNSALISPIKWNSVLPVATTPISPSSQTLNVSINHPFKCKLRELWSAWMSSGSFERTVAGNLKQPSLPVIAQLVKTAWGSIDPAIISKSFKTNTTNG